jgi:ribonuclease J
LPGEIQSLSGFGGSNEPFCRLAEKSTKVPLPTYLRIKRVKKNGIEITTVGGYDEVGRNMTAIKVDDCVIICDMGIHLENYIRYTEDEDIIKVTAKQLLSVEAIPDFRYIEDWKGKVKAIIPTHAHLDHVGAIPFIADKYNAEILCTPFTAAVLNRILLDQKKTLKNKVKALNVNSVYQLTPEIMIEFVNITHSTPQTVMVAIHTKYGIVVYANDFKFDLHPITGKKTDFRKIEELGSKGVLCLIVDSTYSAKAQKMPSESVAREMLKDVMLGTNSKGNAMIVTTFSSHIARLTSIVEFGKRLNRKIVFLGRSLSKYAAAAEDVGIAYFSKEVEIIKYSKQVKKKLSRIMSEGKDRYLMVVTGHQGEPRSTLAKMIDSKMGFLFDSEDQVIFSCTVIPTPTNVSNREYMERCLKSKGVRIFKDIHVSGHAAREDLRDMINMLKPKYIIPAHGELKMRSALSELACEMGYKGKETVFLTKNGSRLVLKS